MMRDDKGRRCEDGMRYVHNEDKHRHLLGFIRSLRLRGGSMLFVAASHRSPARMVARRATRGSTGGLSAARRFERARARCGTAAGGAGGDDLAVCVGCRGGCRAAGEG